MSEAPIKADPPTTKSVKPLRIPRGYWIAASLLLLAVSTLIAFTQSPRPDPFQKGRFLSLDWWRYPLERNSHKRLPEIKCDLNAIFALPDGKNIWAVGNLGMIVHSEDGGKTWSQQKIEASTGSVGSEDPGFSASPTPTPASQSRNIGSDSHLSSNLIAAVYAETHLQSDENPKLQSDPRQQSQRPTPVPNQQSIPPYTQRTLPTPTPTPRGLTSPAPVRPSQRSLPREVPAADSPTTSPTPASQTALGGTAVISENLIAVYFSDELNGLLIDDRGRAYTTNDGGRKWVQRQTRIGTQSEIEQYAPLYQLDLSDRGTILKPLKIDGDKIERHPFPRVRDPKGLRSTLRSEPTGKVAGQIRYLHIFPAPLPSFATGSDGAILKTSDFGGTWIHLTEGSEGKALALISGNYGRWPAPWYYVACLLSALLLAPALKPRPEDALTVKERSIARAYSTGVVAGSSPMLADRLAGVASDRRSGLVFQAAARPDRQGFPGIRGGFADLASIDFCETDHASIDQAVYEPSEVFGDEAKTISSKPVEMERFNILDQPKIGIQASRSERGRKIDADSGVIAGSACRNASLQS